MPLNLYFDGIVTKKMFLEFVYRIAGLIKNCEKNMINVNNLDLQKDRIFIEPQTRKVSCIFWPLVNNQKGSSPHLFLKRLPYDLKFNPHEDSEYIETYKAFFDKLEPFSVNNFEKLILQLQGKKVASGHSTPLGSLADSLSGDNKQDKGEQEEKKTNIEYDPFAETSGTEHDMEVCICSKCGAPNSVNANFCIFCGNNLMWKAVEQEVFPVLVRGKTNENFIIDKSIYKIGTEQKCCDLFICDNNFISRNHADIITKQKRYYIVDRNSTNKTFVDDEVIPSEIEIEIFPGTKIRLANEEFIFLLNR